MKQLALQQLLSRGLEDTLRRGNIWWQGERMFGLPPIRRWAFPHVLSNVSGGGLAPITVVRGPWQIDKATLLTQIIDDLLTQGVAPKRIFRVQFDELPELEKVAQPILDLAWWYGDNILGKSFHQAAKDGEQALLFLDEVQNLPAWAPQLKNLVDQHPVRVVVTGSSALRIEAGRDSLAGRIATLEMGPLLLREIGEMRGYGKIDPYLPLNGLGPLKDKNFWLGLREFGEKQMDFRRQAFRAFSERGAYPVAQVRADVPWERVADQLNETVIRRAIQHDLRSEKHTSELQSHLNLVCRLLL